MIPLDRISFNREGAEQETAERRVAVSGQGRFSIDNSPTDKADSQRASEWIALQNAGASP